MPEPKILLDWPPGLFAITVVAVMVLAGWVFGALLDQVMGRLGLQIGPREELPDAGAAPARAEAPVPARMS